MKRERDATFNKNNNNGGGGGGDGGEDDDDIINRRPRGRPTGSKNKPKPPIIITRDSASSLCTHVLEIADACDLLECVSAFARRRQKGICIFSGSGMVTDVKIRQPDSSGVVLTLHGCFNILSLFGSVLPPPAPTDISGLTIYLAGENGQVVGGSVVGTLLTSGPVSLMAASFSNAAYERLPNKEEDYAESIPIEEGNQQQLLDVDPSCNNGLPPNLLDAIQLTNEAYWARGRTSY